MRDIHEIGRDVRVFMARFTMFTAELRILYPESIPAWDYIRFAQQYVEENEPHGAENALRFAREEAAELGCRHL